MALITRMTRLFRADVHAVLDRIEEPEVLLRQAVREMEEALARDGQKLKRLTAERAQIAARRKELAQALQNIDSELDLCFEAGKDDLARALVRRKLEAERLAKAMTRRQESLDETLSELRNTLDHNREHLESMRQKAELLAEEERTAPEESWSAPDFTVRDADVEVALLREKQRRDRS